MTTDRQRRLDDFYARLLSDVDDDALPAIEVYLKIWPDLEEEIRGEHQAWIGLREMTLAMDEPPGPLPGESLPPWDSEKMPGDGRFEKLHEIGKGGMGVVYKCRDLELGRVVVLKTLIARMGGNERASQRFKREAQVLARLEHKHVCSLHDVLVEEGLIWVVMPFISGETLAQRLARARDLRDGAPDRTSYWLVVASPLQSEEEDLPVDSILLSKTRGLGTGLDADDTDLRPLLVYFEQVCRAVHAVHKSGIVHRDLKPGNLMVGQNGEPVILDFGLARDDSTDLLQTLTDTGDQLGTPPYMSPEQVEAGRCDARTDIWSLGAILYEILTLERPFPASTRSAIFDKIRREDPLPLRRHCNLIPKDLEAVCTKALEKNPARRYADAGALAEDIRRVRTLQPTLARPIGPIGRLGRHLHRRSKRYAVLSILLVALIALVVVTIRERALTETARVEKAFRDYYTALSNRKPPNPHDTQVLSKELGPLKLSSQFLANPFDKQVQRGLLEILDKKTRFSGTSVDLGELQAPRAAVVPRLTRFRFQGLDADTRELRYELTIRPSVVGSDPGTLSPQLLQKDLVQPQGTVGDDLGVDVDLTSGFPLETDITWTIRLLTGDPEFEPDVIWPPQSAHFRLHSLEQLDRALQPPTAAKGLLARCVVVQQLLTGGFCQRALRKLDSIAADLKDNDPLLPRLQLFRAQALAQSGCAQQAQTILETLR